MGINKDFSGGLNLRAMPQALNPNESLINTNLNLLYQGISPISLMTANLLVTNSTNYSRATCETYNYSILNTIINRAKDSYQLNNIFSNTKSIIANTIPSLLSTMGRISSIESDLYTMITYDTSSNITIDTSVGAIEPNSTIQVPKPVLIPKYVLSPIVRNANYLKTTATNVTFARVSSTPVNTYVDLTSFKSPLTLTDISATSYRRFYGELNITTNKIEYKWFDNNVIILNTEYAVTNNQIQAISTNYKTTGNTNYLILDSTVVVPSTSGFSSNIDIAYVYYYYHSSTGNAGPTTYQYYKSSYSNYGVHISVGVLPSDVMCKVFRVYMGSTNLVCTLASGQSFNDSTLNISANTSYIIPPTDSPATVEAGYRLVTSTITGITYKLPNDITLVEDLGQDTLVSTSAVGITPVRGSIVNGVYVANNSVSTTYSPSTYIYHNPDTNAIVPAAIPYNTQYAYSIYDPLLDIESDLQLLGAINKADLDTINITLTLNTNNMGVGDHLLLYLYRIGGKLTDFQRVGSYSAYQGVLSLSDNMTTFNALNTYIYNGGFNIPYTLRYATELNGAVFGYKVETTTTPSINHLLVFSEVGKKHSFKPQNYIRFDEPITGIGKCISGILVFTRNTTTLVMGQDVGSYTKLLISDSIGCIDSGSISYYNSFCIWSDWDYIYMSSGFKIDNVSFAQLNSVRELFTSEVTIGADNAKYLITGTDAIVYKDSYYLRGTYTKVTGTSVDINTISTIQVDTGIILKYNLLTKRFNILHIPNAIANLGITCINGNVFIPSLTMDNEYKFYIQDFLYLTRNIISVAHPTINSVLVNETPLITTGDSTLQSIDWLSPVYTENLDTLPKIYDTIYINIAGSAEITIYTDKSTTVQTISSGDITVFKVLPIKIAQESKTSYWYQLRIRGICRISEFNYSVTKAGGN